MKNASFVRSVATHWGAIWNVPRAFVEAIIQIESGGAVKAENHSARAMALGGAWGLMQITLVTARDVWRQVKPGLTALLKEHRSPFIHRTAADYVLHAWGNQGKDLLDPEVNTCLGTRYMARLQTRFGPDFVLLAAAYHQGPARVARFVMQKKSFPDDLPPNGKQYVTRAVAALDETLKRKVSV